MALFLTGWSQIPASRACHGCSQASDLSRQGARQRQSGHLAFQWRLDPFLELPHWDLDFKSNDKGPKISTPALSPQLSAGSVGKSRFQAVRLIAAAASSSGSRGEQNTDMDVVPGAGVPAQARGERNAEEYGEFGAGAPAQSAAEGREEDDEFQRPRSVRFHDEQMYTISKEEREEHESWTRAV